MAKLAGFSTRDVRRMKSAQIGSAMRLPNAFAPIVAGRSNPTQTPTTAVLE